MSSRLAIGVFISACAWGQMFDLGQIPRAEDSPLSRADNLMFYGTPRGPELAPAPAPAGTISVEQLRHPLSQKAAKLLAKARNFASMGRHDKAIEQLTIALKEPSATPWAHSMLGVEYLKTNEVPAAIPELEEAVKALPQNAQDHSNLGYALLLAGDLDRAESEARRALDLDRNNTKTRRVLSQILSARQRPAESLP